MSREAWDRLFCSLGDRIGLEVGVVRAMPIWEEEMVEELRMANDENAKARNWKVVCGWNEIELDGTGGCE